MLPPLLRARRALWISAALPLLACASATAEVYTWDPLNTTTGSDGAGTWSTTVANWATGQSTIAWPGTGTDTASFGSGGNPGTVTVSGVVGAGGLTFNSAYTVTGGTIALTEAPTITTNANATISSALTAGSATITKAGAGRLTINGATTGISSIAVTSGRLATAVGGSQSFGNSATGIVVSDGASIQVASGATAANAITFNGGSGDAAVIGGATLSGPITLASGNTRLNVGNAAAISGAIGGVGSLQLTGTNKLTLSGANTYSGGTTITDGVLEVVSGGSLGTGAVTNNSVLTLSATGADFTIDNAISGSGSITKNGTGTVVMTGELGNAGTTIVSGGRLIFNGTSTTGTTRQVIVGSGGTLGGTGTILGATSGTMTVLAGGRIAPGEVGEIGTLRGTSLAWTSNNTDASMFFDLSMTGNSCDLISLTGAFTRAATTGNYIFDFGGTGVSGTYTLITYGSTTSTSTANLRATNLQPGYTATFSMSSTALRVTVVPEPGEVGAIIAAFAALVIFLRRRPDFLQAIMKKALATKALRVFVAIALVAAGVLPASARTVTVKLETATFDDLQAAMNAGALTSVELATLYLNRRAVYDQGGIRLNSVVSVNPFLLDEAADADEDRANNILTGPLQGLMFCVKDSYPTKNMVTTAGVRAWLSPVTGTFGVENGIDYGPVLSPGDAYSVAKLKQAGAVLLGHGNMDTWATSASSTNSNAYGVTLNAYILGSSSGSSGGPAVLTGANFANIGFGGETGGSIRNPSDRAGVTGFKVSVGTISVNNIVPLVSERDVIGPMTRYAKDNAYVMDAVATTQDPDDLWASINYTPGRPLPSDFAVKADTTTLAGKKIGVVGTYTATPRPSPAPTPVTLTATEVEDALGAGNGRGGLTNFPTNTTANTTQVDTPSANIAAAFNRARTQLAAEGATVVTVFIPPNVDTGRALPATFVDGSSVPVSTWSSSGAATNSLALTNRSIMDYYGQGTYTRLTQANAASSSLSTTVRNNAYNGVFARYTDPVGVTHFQTKALYNRLFEKWMDSEGLDVLIWPVSYSRSRTSNSVSGRDLVNNIGLPACTVPIGVDPATGEPITMAICGRYRKEADVLAIAAAYQKAYNYRIPSTLAPPLDGETITYEASGTQYSLSALRRDKVPPAVSIKKVAQPKGKGFVIQGVAADAGGLRSLKVYVNGHKVAVKPGKKWIARVSATNLKKWTKSKAKAVEVVVLAKDSSGNASATTKVVKL